MFVRANGRLNDPPPVERAPIGMLPAGSKTIARVLAGDLCSGCGLCASLSKSAMQSDSKGYHRPGKAPPVDSRMERLFAESCPGSRVAAWQEAPHSDPYWGPWHQVMTGYAADEGVRFRASSGGAITALALHALNSGLVDAVLHVHGDTLRPTRNCVTLSRTSEEVIAGAGSRYAASSPLEQIEQLLSAPGRFAFVGKPCDCSALRQFGKYDPRVADKIPLVFSFFCAGIPSASGARKILSKLGVDEEELAEFRYRGHGWPGRATAITHDSRSVDMSYEESWGEFLSKEVQFRCKICPDAVGGVADIACADAWYGGETGYPTFDELPGRSLIMSRTATGDRFLRDAISAGGVFAEPLASEEVALMQPSQAHRKRLIAARMAALYSTFQPATRVAGVMVAAAASRAGIIEMAKNFLGTLRRILTGRR